MFEKYEVPALFVSKNAVLSCFASGKSSGLVIDCGAGTTSVTPVHDGYALQKCIAKSGICGNLLIDEYLKILDQRGVGIKPHYLIGSKNEIRLGEFEVVLKDLPNTTESYRLYEVQHVVRDIKECVCRVADSAFDEDTNSNMPAMQYELPDGHTIDLGTDRFKIPELMFNPMSLNKKEGNEEEYIGLPQMVFNSAARADADIRRELFSSIVLTGGNSLIPQLSERLLKELLERAPPQMYKVKILAANTPIERKFSVWIGGSILGSLGTFQQMWISKQEYEEHGRVVVERKCP